MIGPFPLSSEARHVRDHLELHRKALRSRFPFQSQVIFWFRNQRLFMKFSIPSHHSAVKNLQVASCEIGSDHSHDNNGWGKWIDISISAIFLTLNESQYKTRGQAAHQRNSKSCHDRRNTLFRSWNVRVAHVPHQA